MWFHSLLASWKSGLSRSRRPQPRPARRGTRLTVEQLEDRCTPSTALGGGHSAVLLQVNIQYFEPPDPCIVSVQRMLPNGNVIQTPPDPCALQNAANVPLHDFIPPGALRGLLQSAQVNSSAFIVPVTTAVAETG
jgi:hypothetical protein